jgi:co-chaperonin GroES (HSP10)
MRPIGKRIIAKPIQETTTKSGIVLSGEALDQASKDVRRGVVISSNLPEINPGDTVIYSRFKGTPFKDYIILDEEDVLALDENSI